MVKLILYVKILEDDYQIIFEMVEFFFNMKNDDELIGLYFECMGLK